MKKILCIAIVMTFISSLCGGAFASEKTDPEMQTKGPFVRQFVRYDPSSNAVNYKYINVGSASYTNNGPGMGTLHFYYETSGTTTASLGATVTAQTEINAVIASVTASVGLTATYSKSWTKGTNSGASVAVPVGTTAYVTGYIAGVTVFGSLVYKVYMWGYEDNFWFENVSVSSAKVPLNHVHLESRG